MFLFHIALSITLIALAAGTGLFLHANSCCDEKGSCFAKFIGLLIIITAIFSAICILYCGSKAHGQNNEQCFTCTHDQVEAKQTDNAATTPTATETKNHSHKR